MYTTDTKIASAGLASSRYDGLRNANASIPGVVAPASPVQMQLQRLCEMVSDLRHNVDGLCDPLMSILHHDPREAIEQSASAQASPPSSCDLERTLTLHCDSLQSTIRRVRDINSAIRL